MMKENPLFVDSTKFRGDDVGTKVEVSALFLYEGEGAFVIVINGEGGEQKCPLTMRADGVFEGTVWLVHQQEIQYYVVIRKDDEVIFASEMHEARASYLIVCEWTAHSRQVPFIKSEDKLTSNIFKHKEKETPLGGLLDKWGL